MGNCTSRVGVEELTTTEIEHNSSVWLDRKLMEEKSEDVKIIKVLLLGAGECGKSTILKQLKILHQNGFSMEEKKQFRLLILRNTVESIQALATASETLQILLDNEENRERSRRILKLNPVDVELDAMDDIRQLWKDSGIQRCVSRANEFQLLDSATYFLGEVPRLFRDDYVPTLNDILRSRLPTTGIIQTDFMIDKFKFRMFDVGGQRGERKKWIHCFDNVTAIMFIASLSEYDQVLAEDRTRNRLKESLDLFEGIINLPWFKTAPIILFLNKNDLFQMKVSRVDIGVYFPNYIGGLDYDAGLKFIQESYFDRNQNPDKTIYQHVTDATNTENVAFVWKAAKQMILERNLTQNGMLMV